jgi:peroxiredoxin
MKAARIAGLVALVGFVAVVVIFAARSSRGPKAVPDFSLPDLSGQVVRMRDLRGKVVVLNLWATWCPPCVEEMPTLETLHRHMESRDVVVLAVSQDEDPAIVGPWIGERGFTFPVLLDPLAEVGHALRVTGYPETFVVDRQGAILYHHVGYRDWAEPVILEALEELLESGEWRLTSR